ncbi:MAG: heme exporter protein CcmD [Acidiferrobacteraceae bacterium]|nr:heme exporter protein CcmD [Acidiferrobacteraceae bacterium]
MSISEFFFMGGYGKFVWSSYLIVFIVLIVNLWLPIRRHRRQLKSIIHREDKKPSQNDSSA